MTLINQIYTHVSKLTTFEGWAKWNASSPEGNFRGTLKIIVKTPDSLWMKMEGPFGVDLGIARVCGDSGLFYSPWENRVYKGSIHRLIMNGVIPLEDSHPHIIYSLLGLVIPQETMFDSLLSIHIQDDYYLLDYKKQESLWVRGQDPVIFRWEKQDQSGEVIWKWEGRDFRKTGKIKLPKMIKMSSSSPKRQFTIFYEKVKTNKKLRRKWCKVNIPEDVKIFEL